MKLRETPLMSGPDLHESTLYLGRLGRGLHGGREFDVHFFRDLAHDRIAMAISCGDLGGAAPLLTRVHSSCLTSECLLGQDCDCADQLQTALVMMREEGAGLLFYLMQEGRGAGLTAKARDRMIVQASEGRKTTFEAYLEMGLPADLRRYDALAPMVRMLGLRAPLRLLTNNPDKAAAVTKVLADQDIRVERTERIHGSTSPFNTDYLMAKHDSGHAFAPNGENGHAVGAKPPMPVRVVPPIALRGDSHRVLTASYYLPIAIPSTPSVGQLEVVPGNRSIFVGSDHGAVDWFRMSVIFDGESAREFVLLSHSETSLAEVEDQASLDESRIEVIMFSLLDRLPIGASPRQFALGQALAQIRDAGHGSVAVRFDDRARLTTDGLAMGAMGDTGDIGDEVSRVVG